MLDSSMVIVRSVRVPDPWMLLDCRCLEWLSCAILLVVVASDVDVRIVLLYLIVDYFWKVIGVFFFVSEMMVAVFGAVGRCRWY